MMRKNTLVELIPDKWGLLVYLNEHEAVDVTTVKRFMNDIAESRLVLVEANLAVAEKLLETGLSNRTVIHKSYYSMYHAARSAVYVQMQLDVKEHRTFVNRFKKLLTRQFGDGTLARQMNNWRTERIICDYDIGVNVRDVVCESAISDASMIVNTTKNLVEEFQMDKEEITKIIRDEVSKKFGAERIQEIEYFRPYESEYLDVIVYVEGIDERADTSDVSMRLVDMPYEMNLDVPFHITNTKSGMGEEAAA